MNTKNRSFAFCLTTCLLACVTGHAYEQDNWYLANEWSVSDPYGLSYFEDNSSGVGQIYVCSGTGNSARISVYDLNGSLDRHINIAQARYYAYSLVLDVNGNIYIGERYAVTCLSNDGTFQWRTGKNASATNYGSSGIGDGDFNYVMGITIGPDDLLYIADRNNHRIQVLDKNGNFVRKFASNGTAPGQLQSPQSLGFLSNGKLVIRDNGKIHWFESDGTFIRRINEQNNDLSSGYLTTFQSDEILTYINRHPTGAYVYDAYVIGSDGAIIGRFTNLNKTAVQSMKYATTPSGDVFTSWSGKIEYRKRAYRTKGLPERNVIPKPVIRKISQRSGTNVLDLDFEIIDSDDTNATVGIMAYAENSRVVPQAWTDGTGSKIGTPIATNEVHRVSWDVKQDWNTSTGTIKFEILCQDGRTNKPVDIHFLTLPLADGNLTISRSPIKDTDIENYLKYLVAIGSNEVAYENSTITNGSGTIYLNASKQATDQGKTFFMTKLGHRWATSTEVNNAKIAATPGTTNTWAASRPVSPRGLPKNVNEYGFDTGNHGSRAWWVVKE